ncbi:hypothetical protein Tco_1547394 [Tanacetum coccineum]
MESDEVIKSSVEDLVPILSECKGIFNNMSDVPFCDKNHFDAESDLIDSFLNRDTSIVYSPKIEYLLEKFAGELALILQEIYEVDFDLKEDIRLVEQLLYDNSPPLNALKDHFEIFSDFNDDYTSSDDDSFENIDYVEASPPDSELFILEEVKDDILYEKLLNINLLIAKIESLNDNPAPDCVLKSPSPFPIPIEDSDSFSEKSDTSLSYLDNSLPEFETFSDHTKEKVVIEPDQGELISIVMDDILREPRVHEPNVLPTHPTLMLDSDFIPSDDSLRSDLEVSFPSGTRNKIFDPGIFFEVQSKRFLSLDTFSISFIRNLLCPVIETLLPFSSKNEEQVFNTGILSSTLLSHLGKITSNFSESPMMICGEDIPILDVPYLYFYHP